MSSFKEFDFDPSNLPPDLLQAIGLAIACGAQTESVISMAIGGCLGLDQFLLLEDDDTRAPFGRTVHGIAWLNLCHCVVNRVHGRQGGPDPSSKSH
jgi:hypothetical protein